MSSPGDILGRASAALLRRSPPFRGRARVTRILNRLVLLLGAHPLKRTRMVDGTSMIVDLRTLTERDSYYSGRYDQDLIARVTALLHPDDIVLDIGGNIGFYAVALGHYLAQAGGRGLVHSFEPVQGNYERLQENITLNNLQDRVIPHNLGLSDTQGTLQITLREDFADGASTGNAAIATGAAMDGNFRQVPIALETLDTLWPGIGPASRRISLIKMDIEGHEDLCLQGAQATLAEHRPIILMEVNKPFYAARKRPLNEIFFPLLPDEYGAWKPSATGWQAVTDLDNCLEVDNVFWMPTEKMNPT